MEYFWPWSSRVGFMIFRRSDPSIQQIASLVIITSANKQRNVSFPRKRESRLGCPFSRLRAEALWRASTGMTTRMFEKRRRIIDLFNCQSNKSALALTDNHSPILSSIF
jgi:hypothetical protein